jgi:ABC-type multidrug transport system ATPase subunit/peptidoglycan/LPS O-acetylase OafA/YrhL
VSVSVRSGPDERLHALDAVRGFALLMGVVFHAGFSLLPGLPPGLWFMVDSSPSEAVGGLLFVSHVFRMSLFFLIAGFFGRLLLERRGTRGFVADRGKRILVPLIGGWLLLFPVTAAVWVWGVTKSFGGELPAAPPADMPPPPPAAFPLQHLWFLYVLLILYAAALVARTLVSAVDRAGGLRRAVDGVVRAAVSGGAAVVLLPLPTAAILYSQDAWYAWFGIPTPDRSLIPDSAALVAFGTAFGFGWLVQRQPELLAHWKRQWSGHLGVALLSTAACLWIQGLEPRLEAAAPGRETLVYALCYALAIWSWVFGLLGTALRYLSRERPALRYLADSSYWIYLVHLPVVAALQVLVGHLPWHWSLKLAVILGVSLPLLLASYHLLVRFTWVGAVLNGRKHRRASRVGDRGEAPGSSPAPGASGSGSGVLAELRGVHKRYGSVVALDGVDLGVRPGELLALLGPNGAGKSTAVGLWLGLLEPERGSVTLLGRSPLDVESRRRVGVMMQEVELEPALRVREAVALAASYYPRPHSVRNILDMSNTTALAERRYGRLSPGQKRQVQFALALVGRPRLLFLDEPTAGMDVEARERLWGVVRGLVGQGASVVLTTHYLEEAEALADRVAVLAQGRLVASGTVDEIRSVVSRTRISGFSLLEPAVLLDWPGVVEARRDAGRLVVTASDAEAVVRRLLAEDPGLSKLEVRQAALAEAFTALTREAA